MPTTQKPRMAPSDPRHGTANGYNNLGCRCSKCRVANAADGIARRELRMSRRTPDAEGRMIAPLAEHGLRWNYRNHRCECVECMAAHSKATSRTKR